YILFEQGCPKEDLCIIAYQPQGVSVWEGAEAVHLQAEETKLEYSSRSLKIFSRILDFIQLTMSNPMFFDQPRPPDKDAPVTTVVVPTTVTADASIIPPPRVRVVSKNLKIVADSTSSGGVNVDAACTSKLNEPVDSSDSFYALQDLDSDTLHRIYVPKWNVTNDSVLDDPYVCRDLTDRLAPPALFAQLRTMDYDQLYSEFNVEAARQVCLGAEVRMQAKHTLEKKGGLEDKCAEQAALLSARDVEIAVDAAKGDELRDLKEKNFALKGERDVMSEKIATLESANDEKVSELASRSSRKNSLESAFELFRERIEALQDEQEKIMGDRVAELDAQFLKMDNHLDEEFIPTSLPPYLDGQAIGCAVIKGIQDGLKAGIDHGQAGRDMSVIEAYDPFAEAKYINVVNALGAVDFSLLSELESKKDSFIVVHLRDQRFRGEVKEKRLLLTDVITPLVEPLSSKSLTGEASTSPITTLSTTFASFKVVLPTLVVSDQVLDVEPHNEDPTVVTFEKEELGTSSE
nr:hypothetical protein [Tanacetum cinerariifolium]